MTDRNQYNGEPSPSEEPNLDAASPREPTRSESVAPPLESSPEAEPALRPELLPARAPADPPEPERAARPASPPAPHRILPTFKQPALDAPAPDRTGKSDRFIESVTDTLSLASAPLILDPAQLTRWGTSLRESHALVLSSHCGQALSSAVHLLGRRWFSRHVALKPEHVGKTGAFDGCCLLPSEQSNDEDTFLVVDAFGKSAGAVDALFADTAIGWHIYQDKLRKLGRYLLVLVSPDEVAGRSHRDRFPFDEIPFAPALLQTKFADEQQARELCEEFERQAARGRWGARPSEQCRLLEGMSREQIVEGLRTQGAVAVTEDLPALDLGVDPLLDTVLFVATYFTEIGASDFQDLVLGLLGDQEDPLSELTRPAPEPSSTADTADSTEKEPKLARRQRRRRTTLAERWHSTNHALFARAGLSVGASHRLEASLDSGDRIRRSSVGFSRASHADYLAKRFAAEHHFFYLACFDKLRARGVLMHPSQAVVDAFVKLAVGQAAANPQRHGRDWLLGLIEAAGPQIDGVVVEGEATAEHLATIRRMLDVHQGRHAFIYDRVCSLLRGMLGHPGLRGLVEDTLEQWCRLALYPAVLEIVEGLVHAPNLDAFYWFRRVIDEGSAELRERALSKLRWFACGAPRRGVGLGTTGLTLTILQECREWAESSVANRPSGHAAVLLTAAIAESVLPTSPLDPARAESLPAGMFGWLAQSSASLDALPGIVAWFLSPHLEQSFSNEEDYGRLGGALFWRWFTPDCVARYTDDGGHELRHQLISVWQASLGPLEGDVQFPGAALFQVVVLSDAALRLKASGRFDQVLNELGRAAGRSRIRRWLLLLQAFAQSVQKLQLMLGQAYPNLPRAERQSCKAVRERCASVRDEWRELHRRLKDLRNVTDTHPESKV